MDLSQESIEKIIVGVVTAIVILFLSEPIKAAFKRIGSWIEGFLQSLGFGFQKRYYDALVKSHRWLKLIGIYIPSDLHPPRLQEVYISLHLNTIKDAPTVVWNKIFNEQEKHIVILGLPGSGKSTLLDYFTLVFTGHIKHSLRADLKNPLPIFARLRDLGTQPLLSLIESPANVGLKNVPAGYFERRLKNGTCIVFLDGLDEVLDEKLHKQAVREITAFANTYPDNWIVVTCRKQGWDNQLPNFNQYSVQEFDGDDVRQFIGAWYREVTRSEEIKRLGAAPKPERIREAEEAARQLAAKPAENLWSALRKNENLFRIARTPLILSLVTLVHKNRTADLPQGRARLYRECLDILLDIWDSKDKELFSPDAPSPNDKLLVLKTVAFHFLNEGLLEMDIEGLENLIASLLPTLKKPVSARSLIRQIHERSGVLVEQAIGKYGFAHRALHDYLAASHIAEQNLDALLLDHAAEERWREVILIAIGLVQPKQRAETLLSSLLRRSDENAASLALAGWSLAEDIQITDGLRADIRVKIVASLERTQTAADFSLLSGALFDTDSNALRDWMQSVLIGQNPELRMRVLNTLLPELGPEKATPFVPTLTRMLADSHAESGLRIHAAITLAKIAHSPDPEIWNALISARQENDHFLKSAATWAYCELGRFEELGLVKIPAGEFLMGSSDEDKDARDPEKPQHTLFLSDYYIGKHPVTVDEYRVFVEEGGYRPEHADHSLSGVGNHPVVWVTWKDALAFAKWKGLTLPSEPEWEKAARGTDGRIYPWGDEWRENRANTFEYWGKPRTLWERLRRKESQRTTTTVGFFPQGNSPYGCADMSGNVWEWTRSVFKEYPYDADDGREDENASGRRALRGGSFSYDQGDARCAVRHVIILDLDHDDGGFRVCASPISPERS